MMTTPVSIKDFDFTPYGRYWDLHRERGVTTEKYSAFMTVDPPVERPLRFGLTVCENGSSFEVDSMERHLSTEEVLFAGDKPIILSVAASDPAGLPQAEDVVSLLMEPGDLVVMKPGIWHDACHAVEQSAQYYFLSYSSGDPDEIAWKPVQPAPVPVKLDDLEAHAL